MLTSRTFWTAFFITLFISLTLFGLFFIAATGKIAYGGESEPPDGPHTLQLSFLGREVNISLVPAERAARRIRDDAPLVLPRPVRLLLQWGMALFGEDKPSEPQKNVLWV